MPAVQIQQAAGQHSGTTTTTLSTSVASGSAPVMVSTPSVDEGFIHRLIEAVKSQPCLYNPNHEHYGNKHSSAQYRMQVWQKLKIELGFKDDAHALQLQWKRIRDRYVRERRRRRNANSGESNQVFEYSSEASCGFPGLQDSNVGRERHPSGSSNCSTSSSVTTTNSSPSKQFTEMMRWIEPFLIENMTNNSLHSLPVTATTSSVSGGKHALQQTSQGQNGGTIAVIASTAVTDAGTYYIHQSQIGNLKVDVTNHESAVGSADGTTMRSYHQTKQPQYVSVQNSREYNSSRGHGLPNEANGSRNTNVVSTSATGFTFKPNLYNGSPCSSTTSSEIDVGTSTATTYSGPQEVILQQQQQLSEQQRQKRCISQQPTNMVVLTAVQSQQATTSQQQQILLAKTDQRSRIGQELQTADGGVVTVTARGVAPVSGVIKKDVNVRTNDGGTVTMIIDPTTFYQHGSQKMYRLVNVSELSADALPAAAAASNSVATVSGGELKILGLPQRRKRVATVNVQGMSNGRGHLSDDVLDDVISEKTITIDQGTVAGNERIVLDQRTPNVVAGTNVILGHSIQQLQHQQQASNSHQHPGISVSPHSDAIATTATQIGHHHPSISLRQQQQTGQRFATQTVSIEHPHYTILPSQSLQDEHEANLAFANSIANHLSRLNEDEKAVAKMNIQRILMDARFGLGACARMIHDEELSDVAVAVSTTSHDVVSTQQHVDRTARRIT